MLRMKYAFLCESLKSSGASLLYGLIPHTALMRFLLLMPVPFSNIAAAQAADDVVTLGRPLLKY